MNVNNVGFRVFLTNENVEKVPENNTEFALWIHHAKRDDAEDLYGFVAKQELHFFELLISVSGIGPKGALSILNVATTLTLEEAITENDPQSLSKISGIGAKKAEKIVIELRDKLSFSSKLDSDKVKKNSEAIEVLEALGYSALDARSALKQVPSEVDSTKEQIRSALKFLGGKTS